MTILDRQNGAGAPQVRTPDGEWADAPYVEDSFTINTRDLPAR